VQDQSLGKKGHCPTCKHLLVIPASTKGRPAISVEKEPMPDRSKPYTPAWEHVPEWPERQNRMPDEQADALAELCKEKAGWFIPVYDELSLFLMSITLILLCVANTSMQEQIHKWIARFHDVRVFIVVAILLGGMGLSIYHVFTTREKTDVEKWLMLLFAVLTNAGTGIISGWIVLTSSIRDWQIIFPIWNIINSILIVVMLRYRIVDEECISDRDASLKEVVIGLIAVLIIFFLCNNVFNLHWAITFSICIIYTTCLDKGLQSVFPGLTAQEAEAES
jgi:hypothetical protein